MSSLSSRTTKKRGTQKEKEDDDQICLFVCFDAEAGPKGDGGTQVVVVCVFVIGQTCDGMARQGWVVVFFFPGRRFFLLWVKQRKKVVLGGTQGTSGGDCFL